MKMKTDLTDINIPYGLLDEQTKADLIDNYEKGGAIEVYTTDGDWRIVHALSWKKDRVYRLITTYPSPPWEVIDNQWVCGAKDSSGKFWFHDTLIDLKEDQSDWIADSVYPWYKCGMGVLDFDVGTCDWKDSLVLNPYSNPKREVTVAPGEVRILE
jgi:hypothetical protein